MGKALDNMSQTIIIEGRLPALNEIIAESKSHFAKYAKAKKAHTDTIAWQAKASGIKAQGRVFIAIEWHRKDTRTDPDNVAAAKKFVLDGLVKGGVLKDDTAKYISGFIDTFEYGHTDKLVIHIIHSLADFMQWAQSKKL